MSTKAAFSALTRHADDMKRVSMRGLFTDEPKRFDTMLVTGAGLNLDPSKNLITGKTLDLLERLFEAADVTTQRKAMFAGDAINMTERRAVLHTALRAGGASKAKVDGQPVDGDISGELDRFLAFAEEIRSGRYASASGQPFTDVVNIGIGGSDLGPAMAAEALRPYRDGPRLHFVSNVDGAHLTDVLRALKPSTTLVLIASKTFTTQETMANAEAARRWMAGNVGAGESGRHFAAISTARAKVEAFGIAPSRMFGFWDWVGGRYSIWSSIGLSLAIGIGAERFRAFLGGAKAMDDHFRKAAFGKNLPILLAMIGIWNRNGMGWPALAVLPYEQRLSRFPAYLQQLDMESNGKSVMLSGKGVSTATGPLVFGEPGTNGQHAFYQLLHQGTDVIPADFIIGAEGHEPELADQHVMLIANCLAQTEALMNGRTLAEAKAQLKAAGLPAADVTRLAPHKAFPGGRPTNTLFYPKLEPATLGALIALYEHKVFVQGAVWGVNSYDQWGVELGKELCASLLPMVQGKVDATGRDASTLGLVKSLRKRAT